MDIFPWRRDNEGIVSEDYHQRCSKMSLCGKAEQNEELVFHAYDNLRRTNATVTALVHLGQESHYLEVHGNAGGFNQYEFTFSHRRQGVAIMEVFIDGVQIPESPFRVEVVPKTCPRRRMEAVSTHSGFR